MSARLPNGCPSKPHPQSTQRRSATPAACASCCHPSCPPSSLGRPQVRLPGTLHSLGAAHSLKRHFVCPCRRICLSPAPCLSAHPAACLPAPCPAPAALVDICVDDQRHILYTRTQSSLLQVRAGWGGVGCGDGSAVFSGCGSTWRPPLQSLSVCIIVSPSIANPPPSLPPPPSSSQVFDLGADGKAAPSKVAESTEFLQDAARAFGGRDVFGRGGAWWFCCCWNAWPCPGVAELPHCC